jgi:hypothetical protein
VTYQFGRFEFTGFFFLTLHTGTTKDLQIPKAFPDFKKIILRIWAAILDDFMCAACNAFEK